MFAYANTSVGTDPAMPGAGLHQTRTQCRVLSARLIKIYAQPCQGGTKTMADGGKSADDALLSFL